MLILLLVGFLSFDACCIDSDTTRYKKSQSDDAQQAQPTQYIECVTTPTALAKLLSMDLDNPHTCDPATPAITRKCNQCRYAARALSLSDVDIRTQDFDHATERLNLRLRFAQAAITRAYTTELIPHLQQLLAQRQATITPSPQSTQSSSSLSDR